MWYVIIKKIEKKRIGYRINEKNDTANALFFILIATASCNKSNHTTSENNTTSEKENETYNTNEKEENTEQIEMTQESQGLSFVSNEDGTCYVSGIGSCTDKNIVFPTVAPNGDIVTSISNHAFRDSTVIESIIVSNTITRIGDYAFSGCINLTKVILPDSVVLLGWATFSGCENLESITMSRNIEEIATYAFLQCKNLKSITLYGSVKSIGYQAFAGCVNLEDIVIPKSVECIEGYAFSGCEKITSVTIPQKVIEIGEGAFAGCKNLIHISVDSQNPVYDSMNNCIVLKDKNEIIAVCNNFTIPAGIESIGQEAISGVDITGLTIPKSVKNIEMMAISRCDNLKDIFYEGTLEDWASITKDSFWFLGNEDCYVHCTDATSFKPDGTLVEHKPLSETLNDILQKQYAWKDFAAAYPQYEIIAQSAIAMNITVPEFENVVFVFSGALDEDVSEYKMASVNAPGDVLLPDHFGKTFEKIIEEEKERASYVISDDLMQHLYKYEYIYIYRDDFYYFIRGFRHSNALSSEHIAMFRYNENHKRPW